MKIDKKSWHYKIYKSTYFWFNEQKIPIETNLCQYVRRIIWGSVFTWLIVPAFLLAIIAVVITLIANIVNALYKDLHATFIIFGSIFAVILCIVGYLKIRYFWGSIDEKNYLLIEYFKAKKLKICPLIKSQ